MTAESKFITAIDMARDAGIDPKDFRRELRAAGLAWHQHSARWTVERGSNQHAEMLQVLAAMKH